MHPYERLTVEPDLASGVFGDSQALRAWTLTRESVRHERALAWRRRRRNASCCGATSAWTIVRRVSWCSRTSLEQIAALLRPAHTVGAFDRVGPLQIEEIGHARLGQTHLCHVAVCAWPVEAFALALSA